ncbi:MAG: nucleotide exchange factor GrpE [Bacteroidales bacterium]|nr:nucleotide exchange factor GrpE [Bacteroidales bacterium]MCL2738252.1 nucleotide exchange factor GrpE [Bacteroidales bacterium]
MKAQKQPKRKEMQEENNVSQIDVQEEYDRLKENYEALNDKYLRLVAEFDNYRKRTSRERLELIKTAGEDLIQGILPVLDDFAMAKETIAGAGDLEALGQGVDLIYRKLYQYLESRGLQPIEAIGLPLDTDVHEAVTQFPAEDSEQKGKIIDVLRQGYTLNGKVIRYAKVVVGV